MKYELTTETSRSAAVLSSLKKDILKRRGTFLALIRHSSPCSMGLTLSTLFMSMESEKAWFSLSASLSYSRIWVTVQTARDRFQLLVFFRFLPDDKGMA